MDDRDTMVEHLVQLVALEEDRFLGGCHQQVKKDREKAWHDHDIKNHTFQVDDIILLYDNKFAKLHGKFQMHWLGPCVVKQITNGGTVKLVKLNKELLLGKFNGT